MEWSIKILAASLLVGTAFANPKPLTTANTQAPIPESLKPRYEVTSAWVTKYSGVESCHYEGCPMASGRRAYVGAVACPPGYRLGTKVEIAGKTYTCEDRTATWVQERNGPTFDIFAGFEQKDYQEAISYGRNKLKVYILGP